MLTLFSYASRPTLPSPSPNQPHGDVYWRRGWFRSEEGTMISRYLVDEIVIGGLVLGTLGVLFLSQGLFGVVGNGLLQGLFISSLLACLFGFFGVFEFSINPPNFNFGIPSTYYWLEWAIIGFVTGIFTLGLT